MKQMDKMKFSYIYISYHISFKKHLKVCPNFGSVLYVYIYIYKMNNYRPSRKNRRQSNCHICPRGCSCSVETQPGTYLPSARLMEWNSGYSSAEGLPCWSSYRKMGPRPTSTPSCWMPWWLYTDSRKDWRPALGLMVNMMEKSSGKTPPESQTTSMRLENIGKCPSCRLIVDYLVFASTAESVHIPPLVFYTSASYWCHYKANCVVTSK